jgi:hypothetical protein
MSPILDRSERRIVRSGHDHRILVISFLYPKQYYEELLNRLNRIVAHEYERSMDLAVPASELNVLHFYAGYLNPEDLFNSITRKLDEADWEGKPFTGILLDGLHNVFLQFPRLERNSMVWPMLYDLLRRRDVTVVTTDTTIDLDYGGRGVAVDADLTMRQAKPLLHAIIQAADFFFDISSSRREEGAGRTQGKEKGDISERDGIQIIVRSAVGQERPVRNLFWHREKLVVYEAPLQRELGL